MNWTLEHSDEIAHYTLTTSLNEEAVAALQQMGAADEDVVWDLTNSQDLTSWKSLLEVREEWKELYSKSVVILASEEQMQTFGDIELSMAPSWQECLDLIEMERIERQLGF